MGRHDADGDPAGFELTSRGGLEAERAALLEARDVIQNEIKDLVARMVAARRDGSPPNVNILSSSLLRPKLTLSLASGSPKPPISWTHRRTHGT